MMMTTATSHGTAYKDVRNQLDVYVNVNNARANLQAPWFIGTRFIIVYFILCVMVQLMHLFVIKHHFKFHTLKHLKSLQHVSIIS
jgi:hypothetical protein